MGDIYLGDLDEFFAFHADGTLKWVCSPIEGPFASSAFTPGGKIIAINKNGIIYVIDPQTGHLPIQPLELPGVPPTVDTSFAPPPGLWDGMIINNDAIAEGGFKAIMGSQFKITNTPAIDPITGRIYITGTVQSISSASPEGRFYGIDLSVTKI